MADRAPQDLPREEREGDRGDRPSAAELLGLVEAYRGLKAHLGLMDFSDQIALAARLAETRPRSGESSAAKFKVVLLDEYQDTSVAQALMLSRLFSGPTPSAAAATRSPRSATPTRRSTAGAAPRSPTSSSSAGDFPAARRPTPRRTPSPSTGAPTSGSWPPPTTSPPTLRRPTRAAAAGGQARRRTPARCTRSSTRRTTTSWPGWPTR